MEERFRERIDKVFGSLSSSPASSSSLSSIWCLADDEINRNEWNGDKKVSGLFDSNSFLDIRSPETEPDDLSVDGEERRSIVSQKPNDYNDEEWEIKSSIGMDSTLDMEEEADEDDKVAVGDKEYDYTEDVNDYESEADEWVELPGSFKEIEKDSRANRNSAKLSFKENTEAVHKLNSLQVYEVHEINLSMNTSANEKALLMSEELHVGFADDNCLKPILKRKENQADYKLQKRVRFSSDTRDDNWTVGDKDSVMETSSPDEHEVEPEYMRNPSKHTRYTFDSGEIDEESNRKAYMDFLNVLRSRDEHVVEPLVELPRSVAFVPKRKPMAESKVDKMDKGYEERKGAIAVDTIEDFTVYAMEDGDDTAVNVIRKPNRQYRIRSKEDEEEL